MKEPSSVHCYNHDKLIDKFVLQNECTRHLSSQVSRAMGEAGKEHQALLLHPITKCLMFLEDLLSDVIAKKSKDPFGTIRVARKALSKIRYVS